MLVNWSQSFPIGWRLPNMSFLCISFNCQQKYFLWKLILTPWGVGLVNITFLCISWYFMQLLAKKIADLHPPSWRAGVGKHEFYVQMWIFCPIPSKNNFGRKLTPTQPPHQWGVGLAYIIFLCRSGHFIEFIGKILWNFTPTSTYSHWDGRLERWFLCRSMH